MPESLPRLDTQEAYFTGADGNALFRRSIVPEGAAWASLGILHGYGDHCGRYREVMEWLARRGIACHALDFRGHGRSEGKRGFAAQWAQYENDALAFLKLDALKPPLGSPDAPLFLLGHSNGGLAMASTLLRHRPPGIAGCIFSAPYFAIKLTVPLHLRILAQTANVFWPHLLVSSQISYDGLTSDAAMQREDAADTLNFHGATPRWYLSSLAVQREILGRAVEWDYATLLLLGLADSLVENEAARNFLRQSASAEAVCRQYVGLKHELLRETGREAIYQDIWRWLQAQTRDKAQTGETALQSAIVDVVTLTGAASGR